MNIFNYLMNKKEHEIFKNDDILSYLLKKGRVHTASGTEINIKNAKGFEELTLSKLSTQETTTGKNLANYLESSIQQGDEDRGTIQITSNGFSYSIINLGSGIGVLIPIDLKSGETYYLKYNITTGVRVFNIHLQQSTDSSSYQNISNDSSFTCNDNFKYIRLFIANENYEGTNTGTISNIMISKGSSSQTFEPYTYGASPNPSYPQEVNTVKGYRNLFNYNDFANKIEGFTIQGNSRNFTIVGGNDVTYFYPINLQGQQKITGSWSTTKLNGNIAVVYEDDSVDNFVALYTSSSGNGVINFTTSSTKNIKQIRFKTWGNSNNITINDLMITKGTEELPYVPYGTNWIYTTISDGTNSRNVTIPLNDNEICGIGDYKDELVIDKYGHAKLNKKIGKVVLDGSEEDWIYQNNTFRLTIADLTSIGDSSIREKSNYYEAISYNASWGNYDYFISNTNGSPARLVIKNKDITSVSDFQTWLSTHNTDVYYVLSTPTEIDLGTVDMELYEGTNNITNSEDMDMVLKYYK